MSILIKGIPLCGYEISIMKDGERYRARVDGIWCEVEEIPTTEPDTDTISRQAAIDALHMDTSIIPFKKAREYADATISEIRNRLEKLPSAEPKRGKWIDKGWTGDWQYLTDGRGNCWKKIVCSECGKSVRHESKFCPMCGAKMEVTT